MAAKYRSTNGAGLSATELIELAAIVAIHGAAVVRGAPRLSSSGLQDYWSVSKCRLDRWGRYLKNLAAAPALSTEREREASDVVSWFEEIFASEALTRVWTATVTAHDRIHGSDAGASIVRLVLLGHIESRHRALRLLMEPRHVAAREATALDRFRRRVERWTDLLLAHVAAHVRDCPAASGLDLCQWATNPVRARDFADDLAHQSRTAGGGHAWSLAIASLRAAFHEKLCPQSPNADLNYALAASIVSCFSPELFDSTGSFHSLWVMRLFNHASDAEGLIENLLTADDPSPDPSGRPTGPDRRRRFN